jgi:hypothetical protein
MPFAFAIIGLVLLVSGVRGTPGDLVTLLKGDITGSNNFVYWILSIGIIGALGYVEDFRPLSRAFLVLVIVVLVLAQDKQGSGGGFFTRFQQSIATITESEAAA